MYYTLNPYAHLVYCLSNINHGRNTSERNGGLYTVVNLWEVLLFAHSNAKAKEVLLSDDVNYLSLACLASISACVKVVVGLLN